MIPDIATKTGDAGTTALWDGTRVSKTDPRIACVGELDLFHAALGKARVYLDPSNEVDAELIRQFDWLQQRIFSLMGEVATSNEAKEAFRLNARNRHLTEKDVEQLESVYAWLRSNLNARGVSLKQWAVYGTGGAGEAEFDFARGICRQAELALWGLSENGYEIRSELTVFINRFSDLLFLVGRHLTYVPPTATPAPVSDEPGPFIQPDAASEAASAQTGEAHADDSPVSPA